MAFRRNRLDVHEIMRDGKDRLFDRITPKAIGHMHMFFYDPKTKEKLPYYDSNPLIFPIEMYDDGFLGINLHYLNPFFRVKLMDALWNNLSNDKFDETTKLKISYKILKGISEARMFKPCVKRYLNTHVRSRFLRIPVNQWDFSICLPVERFVKANKSKV